MSNVRTGDSVHDLIIKQNQGMAAFPRYPPDDVGCSSRLHSGKNRKQCSSQTKVSVSLTPGVWPCPSAYV